MIYLNWRGPQGVETVDEFPNGTRQERDYAREMRDEYNLAYGNGCYLSQRCTREWRES